MENSELTIIREILASHIKEIEESRAQTNKVIVDTIDKKIKEVVNGKIDNIKIQIEKLVEDGKTRVSAYYDIGQQVQGLDKKIDGLIEKNIIDMQSVQPVVEAFTTNKKFGDYVMGKVKFWGIIGGAIISFFALLQVLKEHIKL